MKKEKVVILGASDKPERYSYKAFKLLQEYGHEVFPVHPRLQEVEGKKCYSDLSELVTLNIKTDTLTMYVNPELSTPLKEKILKLKPGRVIFNPGTENPELEKALREAGIACEEACTLVLLRTNQY